MNYNELKCSNLEELCIYVARGITPKYVEKKGITVINQKCIRDYKINLKPSRQHNLSQKKISDVKYLNKYDILINATGVGTAGRVAQWTENKKATCDSHVLIVRPNSKKIDPLYLGYAIKSKQKQIEMFAEGSTGQTEINKNRLNNEVEITYPKDIKDQKKIASILSSLDDKIELNNKINKNLEEMAQAIFKSWFVDFEPWGGEMPDDWEYTILDNIISKFTSGLNPRKNFKLGEGKNYYVTIKNMSDNNIILDSKCDKIDDEALYLINKRSQLDKGDILFSAIGTIGRVFYLDKINSNWNISESIFSLRAKDKKLSSFLYQLLLNINLQNYVKSLATGSAQKGIRKKDFIKYSFAYNEKQATKYSKLYGEPILKQIKKNTNENLILLRLRDTLLPKLMSGELDVSNLEI